MSLVIRPSLRGRNRGEKGLQTGTRRAEVGGKLRGVSGSVQGGLEDQAEARSRGVDMADFMHPNKQSAFTPREWGALEDQTVGSVARFVL